MDIPDDTVFSDGHSSLPSMSDCRDNSDFCEYWAGVGECEVNPRYMLFHCKVSCHQCDIGTVCKSNPCRHGGSCEEAEIGFKCMCPEGFTGELCDYDPFIQSVLLIGERRGEGIITISSSSDAGGPTKYMMIHQDGWNSNASRLVCQYLGFKGVYATVTSNHFNVSSLKNNTKSAFVECPVNATIITDCMYNDTRGDQMKNESIGVVCCSINQFCDPPGSPVGLENGNVPDAAISAFSHHVDFPPSFSRLNGLLAWVGDIGSLNRMWIQVKFDSVYLITAVITQGNGNKISGDLRVTSYTVSSSVDCETWIEYLDTSSGTAKGESLADLALPSGCRAHD
ncbi:EGF-like repeat and discoidin I-like domain-containing protein 3 [Lytechinus variegatus]|uniref:EGF-like repeat and discoidin I-like domain-containing protein 3 n=1 Tax=Lytechinus variegatus TaxID=7654 RepID=UPI001BB24BF1|nr:EGF-like repeat and discoidin I-like domain-containing protein 3 [Lytechinus variegatus]